MDAAVASLQTALYRGYFLIRGDSGLELRGTRDDKYAHLLRGECRDRGRMETKK